MDFLFQMRRKDLQGSHTLVEHPDPSKFVHHCHSTYELLYIVHGAGKYVVEGVEYPLRPHTLFLIRPYEYHYFCPDVDRPYERFVFNFEESLLPDATRSLPFLAAPGASCFLTPVGDSPIPALFEAMGAAMRSFETILSSGGDASAVSSFFAAAIPQTLQFLVSLEPERPLSDASAPMSRVIAYLNEHLSEELSLDLISKEFFISKYYLCRTFRKQTGTSIFNYFTAKRMALAQQLLSDGSAATSVAERLGFRDYSTFYRAFCKQTGHPPVRSR